MTKYKDTTQVLVECGRADRMDIDQDVPICKDNRQEKQVFTANGSVELTETIEKYVLFNLRH